MANLDSRGLPLSTNSDEAAARYREGVDLLLSAWPGADAVLDAAIAADPDFALAHAARARLHAIRAEMPAARACIARAAERVARHGTARERSHVEVLSLAIQGASGEVVRIGGSGAQREIVQDTLLVALMRSGQAEKARLLLDGRLHRRPSPRDAAWRAGIAA